MWESRGVGEISKGRWEEWETGVWFSTLSTAPSFPQPGAGASDKAWRPGRFALATAQELGFGRTHLLGQSGIAHGSSELIQLRQADAGLQIARRLREGLQLLVWRYVVWQRVPPLAFAACIPADRGKATGTMKVQIGVQMRRIELLQPLGIDRKSTRLNSSH